MQNSSTESPYSMQAELRGWPGEFLPAIVAAIKAAYRPHTTIVSRNYLVDTMMQKGLVDPALSREQLRRKISRPLAALGAIYATKPYTGHNQTFVLPCPVGELPALQTRVCSQCGIEKIVEMFVGDDDRCARCAGLKLCGSCGEWKPLAGFHRAAAAVDGRQSVCRECKAALPLRLRAPFSSGLPTG